MLVFSLREDPEEAGSNTGKDQVSLSATVREELSPPSMSFHLTATRCHPHSGESSCFESPSHPSQEPSSLCFSCFLG